MFGVIPTGGALFVGSSPTAPTPLKGNEMSQFNFGHIKGQHRKHLWIDLAGDAYLYCRNTWYRSERVDYNSDKPPCRTCVAELNAEIKRAKANLRKLGEE